jgi:hypothetical protein
MSSLARHMRTALVLAALTLGALSAAVPIADASAASPAFKVPFADPYVHGWLTFCNRNDQPVTSGSLDTVPFVWKAISSAAPPAGYRSHTARATLYGYQPIHYVDPGDWSGSQLTAASVFSNPDHPVAQATNADQPLVGFVQAYPAHWDGLEEIRMMYTAVNEPQLQMPYAAAVIRINGSRWTLVEGGGGSCSQGKGTSVETLSLSRKELAKPETASVGGKSSAKGNPGSSSSPGDGTGSSSNSGHSGYGGSARLASADSSTGGISPGELAGIGAGALAVIWAAIALIARRRRRAAG